MSPQSSPLTTPFASLSRKPSKMEIADFSTIPTKDETASQHNRSQSVSRTNSNLNVSTAEGDDHIPEISENVASGVETPETVSGDLSEEVQALSNKLIKAINHQSSLEEGLEETKHELGLSKERIIHLEAIAREHQDMMATGVLVEKREVEQETRQLMNKLMEETVQRGKAEKEKKHIEQDLENLTTSLFEEANKMVIAARREREAVIRRNDQLEHQLSDTEVLLATHQEQLTELKMALQQMTVLRDELEASSSPTTPALRSNASKESLNRIFDALHIPHGEEAENLSPSHPTSFTNILQPVLRSDISAFHDFCNVLHMSKHFAPPQLARSPASSSISTFSVMGFGGSPKSSPMPSSSSFFGHSTKQSISSIHSTASSASAPVYPQNQLPPAPALRDTSFFKRAIVEDIEPTLRLDSAPGISWLARRTVLTAVIDGTLVIEIMPPISKLPIFSCAMCGETRNDPDHARTHRFRINETETAQKYPLCSYCVNRLRSVCAFLAFLRTAKEGYIKCETEEDEKNAWEESVKLREQMFWSRVGGGVIPAFAGIKEDLFKGFSPRSSTEGTVDGSVGTAASRASEEISQKEQLERQRNDLRLKLSAVTVATPPMNRRSLPPALPARGSLFRAVSDNKSVQTSEEDFEAMDNDAKEKEKNESSSLDTKTTASLRSRDSHLPSPPESPMMSTSGGIMEEPKVSDAETQVVPGAFN